MRKIGHLTPRYIKNRLKVMVDEARHPHHPWLTQDSVTLLESLLKDTDTGVEFGSGRSTHWFLSKAAKLKSVETNSDWYDKVKADCAHEIDAGRLDYVYAQSEKDFENVIAEIDDESMDFCLVDGDHRDLSALRMVKKIKKGGMIVVDNINRYIPCDASHAPNTRKNSDGCETPLWEQYLKEVRDWRYIWTTNGVTDTSFWIRK
jgi:predicted O-methyltransferase YrrM